MDCNYLSFLILEKHFSTIDKLTLADILLPNMIRSCNRDILKKENTFTGQVIIVGAGVAGLYAACLLKELGIDFIILEASNKIGGRIAIDKSFTNHPLDLGAEWLHGKTSILGALVESTQTEIFHDISNPLYLHKGKLKKSLPKRLQKIFTQLEEIQDDISFEDFFLREGGKEEELNLLTTYSGDVGASANMISAKWEAAGYSKISYGNDDHKFRESYFDFIHEHIAKPVINQVKLNTVVSEIDHQNDKVLITDKNGNQYKGDKILITVPLTILKEGDINFSPPLPDQKQKAFNQLGMEAGMKVFLKFSQTFAEADILGGKTCAYYVIESYKSYPGEFIIMAFINGQQAKKLSNLGEEKAVEKIIAELDILFDNKASEYFVDAMTKDWFKEPYIRGAYSYPLVGSTEYTREIIAKPIDDKLFFAGEATNFNGHHQTVHGAVETAYREVISILESITTP